MSVTLQPSGLGNLAAPYYTGLSTDNKPLPASGRATFYETDTGTEWVLVDGEWRVFRRLGVGSPSGADATALGPQLLCEILSELRKIRRGVELALQTEIPDPGE